MVCYLNVLFLQLTSDVCGSPANVLRDPFIQPNVSPLVFASSCRAKTSEMENFILFLPFFIQLAFSEKKLITPCFVFLPLEFLFTKPPLLFLFISSKVALARDVTPHV